MNSTHTPETGVDSGLLASPELLRISWGSGGSATREKFNNNNNDDDKRLAVWGEDAAQFTALT